MSSAQVAAPEPTNNCGTFLLLRYLRTTRDGAVPPENMMKATCSCSTSLRVCSTVLGGLNASSSWRRLIFLPLMPPSSLTLSKYAFAALMPTENPAAGPLRGRVCPIRISVSVTPGASAARTCAGVTSKSTAEAAAVARKSRLDEYIVVSKDTGTLSYRYYCLHKYVQANSRRQAY